MLPEAHLTPHSKMSGSRWVVTPSWLSWSLRSFLYNSSVYSCHLFLISSASFRSIPFLSFIVPIFAWNVPVVSLVFLKSSRLSHSIVLIYFFALTTWEVFLTSLCYSLELCIQMDISFLSSFAFSLSSFLSYLLSSSDSHFGFLHFFSLHMVLIIASCTMLWTSIHSSSGTLSDLIPWIYLSLPLYNLKGVNLGHTWMV